MQYSGACFGCMLDEFLNFEQETCLAVAESRLDMMQCFTNA